MSPVVSSIRPRQTQRLARVCTLFALFCLLASAPAMLAAQEPNGLVVLMYHRFGEAQYPSTNIRLEQFEAHLAELRRSAYTVVPLEQAVRDLQAGKALPGRAVAISIDDAYASVYTEAWPRLREAGFPFTVFVATDPVDRGFKDLMTWAQMRELAASGLAEFANHSVTHAHLPQLSTADARGELVQAQARLEAELGQTAKLLAYPYGEESAALRDMAQSLGFLAAFGQHSGVAWQGDEPLLLPRFALNEHYGAQDRFKLAINALPLPVQDYTPRETLVPQLPENPPTLAFQVLPEAGDLGRLACYGPSGETLKLEIAERQVRLRLPKALGPGRSRVNCTLPANAGRWRWLGRQFYHPG